MSRNSKKKILLVILWGGSLAWAPLVFVALFYSIVFFLTWESEFSSFRSLMSGKPMKKTLLVILWGGSLAWTPLVFAALFCSIVFFFTWGSGDGLWDSDSESGD